MIIRWGCTALCHLTYISASMSVRLSIWFLELLRAAASSLRRNSPPFLELSKIQLIKHFFNRIHFFYNYSRICGNRCIVDMLEMQRLYCYNMSQ